MLFRMCQGLGVGSAGWPFAEGETAVRLRLLVVVVVVLLTADGWRRARLAFCCGCVLCARRDKLGYLLFDLRSIDACKMVEVCTAVLH